MKDASDKNVIGVLGQRIRKARLERNLTQEALAGPEFTKGYVSALERGAVRPSLKALEVFARRLEVPITEFLEAKREQEVETEVVPELDALEEDLHYQFNYAKMLIRTDQVDEALQLIREAEESAQPYKDKLPVRALYRIPYLRGLAHYQTSELEAAQGVLQDALLLAKDVDPEAETRVRNLLGIVHYDLEQPQLAMEHHLQCLHILKGGGAEKVKDLNLCVTVYHNLANDYWGLNEPSLAISVYKEALELFDDLHDIGSQAAIFWGLAMAYRATGDWPYAKLYATRALHIYEAIENQAAAATMSITLAELFVSEGRYQEAYSLLDRAEGLLQGTGEQVLFGNLYYDYAELERKQGKLEMASEYINRSLELLKANLPPTEIEVVEPKTDSGQDRGESQEGSQEVGQEPEETGGQEGLAEKEAGLDQVSRQGNVQTKRQSRAHVSTIRTYVEALQIAALIEEERGHTEAADNLFGEALQRAGGTGFEETLHTLNFSYGEVLKKRGNFEQAMEHYRASAQTHPYSNRRLGT